MMIKRLYDTLVGASVGWNQLAKALVDGNYYKGSGTAVYDNGTVSFTAGGIYGALYCTTAKELVEYHKYLISAKIKMTSQPSTNTVRLGVGDPGYNQGAIYVPSTESVTSFTEISGVVQYSYGTSPTNNYLYLQDNRAETSQIDMKDFMLIDLTAMFGSSIADYIYSLKTATAGAGIAKLKEWGFFTGEYIPYNAGTLESVEATAHKTVGFNQWDEEWEVYGASGQIKSKNRIPVIEGATYYLNSPKGCALYLFPDKTSASIGYITATAHGTFSIPQGVHYIAMYTDVNYGTTYNHDICINLSSDRNGEYEPYHSQSYPLGNDVLRGIFKLDANNQLYADGDVKTADGVITRKYGIRAYQSGDESLADSITDGTTTVYKLTTPTTEQGDPFPSPQVCYPDGTEEYVTSNSVPVGHETRYQL